LRGHHCCDLGDGDIERAILEPQHEVVFLGARNRHELLSGIGGADVLLVQWARMTRKSWLLCRR
jgi:hypothetical protein